MLPREDGGGLFPAETLSGLVDRVVFHNEDNGFCVLRVGVQGQREPVTLTGHACSICVGETIEAQGLWVSDPAYGRQFQATALQSVPPTTRDGIERYLASGTIRGIGSAYAKRLLDVFGSRVLDVIENEPERLSEVSGIGPKRIESIRRAWEQQRAVRDITMFLYRYGVSTARANRIYKIYGHDAIRIISDDPYRLARDIRGIGFVTADEIAMKMGIEKISLSRARAGISYVLMQATEDGHCGLFYEDFLHSVARLLDIPETLVSEALELELADGTVARDETEGRCCVFLMALYRAESCIAERIAELMKGMLPWGQAGVETRDIELVEKKMAFHLSDNQKDAIQSVLSSKLSVITGGPGVGKTTLINAILRVLEARGVNILLCAPTGRSAKRMSEATGCEARTIHRLLEFDPGTGRFRYGAASRLKCELLIIDEMSMVDVPLMSALMQAVPDKAAVIFAGDVDQLSSVGPGQVLSDIIESGLLQVARLTEVFRQAAESRIIANAHRINAGLMPEFGSPGSVSDCYFIPAEDPETVNALLLEVVRTRIPQRFGLDPVRDIQVLCPMNRGGLGARALNVELQAALNSKGTPRIERFGSSFAVGDKVMQIENSYEKKVYNGDIGFITAIDVEMREVLVDFGHCSVTYGFRELDEIVLAYATSIHKSQGSEYPAVVMPVMTQHYAMLRRNLLYTAVTRSRKLLVLIGTKRAIAIAVNNATDRQRCSRLRSLLERCKTCV